jgi:DNA invertase Pin-like site-specific DNA recombinase
VTNFPTTSQPIPLYPPSKLRAQRRPGPIKPRYGVPRSEWPIILRRVEQGESLRGVAQDYHVSYQTIHRIVQTGRKQGEEGQQ